MTITGFSSYYTNGQIFNLPHPDSGMPLGDDLWDVITPSQAMDEDVVLFDILEDDCGCGVPTESSHLCICTDAAAREHFGVDPKVGSEHLRKPLAMIGNNQGYMIQRK